REAATYGQFLLEVLTHLAKWHASRALYDKEGRSADLPGFQKKWGPTSSVGKINEEDHLDYDEFRHTLYNWHIKVFEATDTALSSGDPTGIRNAIMILREVSACFPAMALIGEKLSNRVRDIAAKETRHDLKLLANAYLGVLKNRENSRSWVAVNQFHLVKVPPRTEPAKVAPTSTTTSGNSDQGRVLNHRSDPRTDSPTSCHDGLSDRDRGGRSSAPSSSNSQPTRDGEFANVHNSNNKNSNSNSNSAYSRDTRLLVSPNSSNAGRRAMPLPPKPGTLSHNGRASRDVRERRELRDSRGGRGLRDRRFDGRDGRDTRDGRDGRDARDARDGRDTATKETAASLVKPDKSQELFAISLVNSSKNGAKDGKDKKNKGTVVVTSSVGIDTSTSGVSPPSRRDRSSDQDHDSPHNLIRTKGHSNTSGDRPKETNDSSSRDRTRTEASESTNSRDSDAVSRAREAARKATLGSIDHRNRRETRDAKDSGDSREGRDTTRSQLRDAAPRDPRGTLNSSTLARTNNGYSHEGQDRTGSETGTGVCVSTSSAAVTSAGAGSSTVCVRRSEVSSSRISSDDRGHRDRNGCDTRSTRDGRDSPDSRDDRDGRDSKDRRDARESRDSRDTSGSRDARDTRDILVEV
ncbi:THO complex subunit 2, partial [Podila humilis]